MGTLTVRLPESLHQRARELVKKEHVLVYQLMTAAGSRDWLGLNPYTDS